jgi:trehalose synthase-fused probable maltokinase
MRENEVRAAAQGGHASGPPSLLDTLRGKRWFGEKGRELTGAEITDTIPVQWPDSDTRYLVARVRAATGKADSFYQLFLIDGEATYRDALEDDGFRRGLVHAFATGASFESGGARWIIESESDAPFVVPASAPIRLSTAEQSNSSVMIGSEAVLKLFRRLSPGVHPDLEVTRFLTIERRFVHTPVLLGAIHFADANGVSVAGMLQEQVPGAVDGWHYALGRAREFFAAQSTGQDVPFAEDAEQLGAVTRALHDALASGEQGSAFEMHPATEDDVRVWAQRAQAMIDRSLRSLERALSDRRFSGDAKAPATAAVERRQHYLDWIDRLASGIAADAGASIRVHGDYHLGQVLRSVANRFLVIDFEGEPSRPLEERRARTSPLRDVAGMLRSFSYAAAAAAAGAASVEEAARVRVTQWEQAVRAAFLRGYFGERGGTLEILPSSRTNAGRVMSFFEAEKLFYELQYELDHRPDWVWIPLRGITELDR